MTDSWPHTRASAHRLKTVLQEADEDSRYRFAFWFIGLTIMAAAIVIEFGWCGATFCVGAVIYFAGTKPAEIDPVGGVK